MIPPWWRPRNGTGLSSPPLAVLAAAARPATRPEALLYQEWRLAAWYHDLHKRARTLGDMERARTFASGLPGDVAAHPFVRRLLISSEARDKPTGSFDDLLRITRQRMDDTIQSMVDLQRNDNWVQIGRAHV